MVCPLLLFRICSGGPFARSKQQGRFRFDVAIVLEPKRNGLATPEDKKQWLGIGAGGMALVLLAEDTRLTPTVVPKPLEFGSDPQSPAAQVCEPRLEAAFE